MISIPRQHLAAGALVAVFGCALFLRFHERMPAKHEVESVAQKALFGQDFMARERLKQWAELGLPVAQRELGLVYAALPNRQTKAIVSMTKAAEAGDVAAQFFLAEAYYKGRLQLERDFPLALRWYHAAAKQNHGGASLMLARMTKAGEACVPDPVIAAQWLVAASKQGNEQAMFLLSNAYASGDGLPRDEALAQHWLHRSAEAEYPIALQALALQLEQLPEHGEENRVKARHIVKENSDERLMNWKRYQ